jgi:hypothetical protein
VRRIGSLLIAALLGVGVAMFTAGGVAHAATVTVTIPGDVVNAADGQTSLREAVDTANAAGAATTIVLAAATTYTLSLCGADDDTNAGGDLDYTAGHPLTVTGNGATITQTCADQRVFDATDATGSMTVTTATISGGEGEAAAIRFAGDVILDAVVVADNDAATGAVLDNEPSQSGTALTLTNSVVGPNTGTGVGASNGTVTITDTKIVDNTGSGVDLVDGALTVAGSLVEGNDGDYGVRTTAQGEGLFPLTDTVVRDNAGVGVVCSNCGNFEATRATVTGNGNGGILVSVDQDAADDDVHVHVVDSGVTGNTKAGPGAGLALTITELADDAPLAQIVLTRSTFAGNTATGAGGQGGAVHLATGELRVDNATVTANTASVAGGGVFVDTADVHLRHATIAGNTAPTAANVSAGAELHAFASIVAAGAGGGADCVVSAGTTSGGYNVSGDASCGFAGTGDKSAAGDPLLGPLQDNGGLTATRVPAAGSPAVDIVPAAACTVFTSDQRGLARPQGEGCEAGAAELAAESGGGGGLPITGAPVGGLVTAGIGLLIAGIAALVLARRRRPTQAP